MKRSTFLLITACVLFAFGSSMFLSRTFAADFLGLDATLQINSGLKAMGGLLIGSSVLNYLLRHQQNPEVVHTLLLTNIVTHTLGFIAASMGVAEGTFTWVIIAPVIVVQLFIVIGSGVYLLGLKNQSRL